MSSSARDSGKRQRAVLTNARDLQNRAEQRLRKMLAESSRGGQNDAETRQLLYKMQLNQIELELLNEEFAQLRQAKLESGRARSVSPGGELRRGYFIFNRSGRILEASLDSFGSRGAEPCELVGHELEGKVLGEGHPEFRYFLERVFQSGAIECCEMSLEQGSEKTPAACKLPLYASIRAVSNDARQICLAVVEDITAIKQSEERERARNSLLEMLHQTIAASLNEIFMFDAETLCFNFANTRAMVNLGYTQEELQQMTPLDIQPGLSRENFNALIAPLLRHEKAVQEYDAIYRRKDGTPYPVEVHLQYCEQEGASYFLSVALDTSEQIAAESQLRSIVEAAGAIIWASDAGQNLNFVSNQVMEILGYAAEKCRGKKLAELFSSTLFHEDDWSPLSDGLRRVLDCGDKIKGLRLRARHADGTWRWLSLSMTPAYSVDGKVCRVVGVMQDIHSQKLAEEELHRMNQELDRRVQEEIQKNRDKDLRLQQQSRLAAMGEMIGNIAHQWRQPINSLGLILTDLEDAAVHGECDRQYMHQAVAKSNSIIQRMSRTIDDFRNFYRVDKNFAEFGLRQVTEECLNLVDAAMRNHGISIVVECQQEVMVWGNASEYSQALMNILSNAKDAIVEKNIVDGRISIKIGEDGGHGVETVTDNGGGIARDVLPRIFDPLFTTKPQGVGIGLYMTRTSIEKNMQGSIAVCNADRGAQFIVRLPKKHVAVGSRAEAVEAV